MNGDEEIISTNRWISLKSLFICLVLFLVSVFCMYVTAESDKFYGADIVVLEFLVAILSGGASGFVFYRFIFPAEAKISDEKKTNVKDVKIEELKSGLEFNH